MDLKKTFDTICTVPGSIGAVMIREDGEIARTSGDMNDPDEAYALSSLMKDAAQLVTIALPTAKTLTRVAITRQSGTSIVATLHHNHVFAVKQTER
ncbi:hypothetical protein H4R99_007541 [Coemansia sp. RSA 1722]|nr:hypothetical protein IWW45_007918 [Coemansia sp. RSA 485]KAJ2589208.1 hypothetical protein H4R99_007541 [Coemansia sp. RSA 1722]KAJ2601900.1 hypothetical protein GGF39_001001 [Coemansia sp. RSA 1721]KAJ2637178.1 hypothetical protein GGF40_002540 [Coemansia sp. RSA 1286]KAJ2707548.1 hypothetical protein FB645_000725 [Coemansia sp. IMI 203386]